MGKPKKFGKNALGPVDSGLIIEHCFYEDPCNRGDESYGWSKDHLVVCAFDPGKTNLGFGIEIWHSDGRIETRTSERFQFVDGPGLYAAMVKKFDEHLEDIKLCHYIFLERQLKINYNALRIMQHILSYLSVRLLDSELQPYVFEVPPTIKSETIGEILYGGKLGKVTKPELKKMSVECALILHDQRDDKYAKDRLNSERKKDDRADVTNMIRACMKKLQLEAWFTS